MCHCEGASRPWQSREGTDSSYRTSIKTHQPIASVAALSERLWQLQISAHPRRPHTPCRGRRPRRPVTRCQPVQADDKTGMVPELSLRGGRRPTWQSREGSYVFADGFPAIRPGPARFPRRFAPRNDKPGGIARSAKPLCNLPACKALTERRYIFSLAAALCNERRHTPYFGACRFNDALYESAVYRRARCPLPYSTQRPAGFSPLYHIPREKSTLSEKSGLSS